MDAQDDFTKLKKQVTAADSEIRAALEKDTAELGAIVDDARRKANERAAELGGLRSNDVHDESERNWEAVQSSWDEHVRRIQERIASKKSAADLDVAEHQADWAEADAYDAVAFAAAAIEEAQFTVLTAVKARKDAAVMAAAT